MIKPIKHFGQNFLINKKAAEDIIEAAEIKERDVVLEIGPGEGFLTEELLKRAGKVIAVEKDRRLAEVLKEKFAKEIKNGQLELVLGDILENPPHPSLVREGNFSPPDKGELEGVGYKIVANIPYYITSPILRKFLSDQSASRQPRLMVLMVQKEVAQRIIAKDKKESLLSLSVKAYGKAEIIRIVPKGNFRPMPKVDSAVIKISKISKDFFKDIGEVAFFGLVKKGFSHKRKMLMSNLKASKTVFEQCDMSPKARAEEVSLEQWKCLTQCQGLTLTLG